MNDQLQMFVRKSDPETSVIAARKQQVSYKSRLIRIAAIVDQAGYLGATADDIYTTMQYSDPRVVRSTVHRAASIPSRKSCRQILRAP